MRAVFGDEHGELYTRVTTMFVESAALYSIWGIMLVIAVGRGDSGLRNIFQGAIGHVQASRSIIFITFPIFPLVLTCLSGNSDTSHSGASGPRALVHDQGVGI